MRTHTGEKPYHMQPDTEENANMVESLTDKPNINTKHSGEKPLPNPKEDTDKILTESKYNMFNISKAGIRNKVIERSLH